MAAWLSHFLLHRPHDWAGGAAADGSPRSHGHWLSVAAPCPSPPGSYGAGCGCGGTGRAGRYVGHLRAGH
eukprot:13060883-Alexandrium_andersonii.AAC.1